MRRTLIIIAIVVAASVVLGYLAHTFDLVELIRSTHGGSPPSH